MNPSPREAANRGSAHALRDGVLLTAISAQLPEGAEGEYWLTFDWGSGKTVGLVVEVVGGAIELRNGQTEAEFCERLQTITGDIGHIEVGLTRPTAADRRAHVADIVGERPGRAQWMRNIETVLDDPNVRITLKGTADTSGNVEPPTITGGKPNRAARRKAAKRKGRSRR